MPGLVRLLTDQRIPGPVSCRCLEPRWFVGDITPLARDNTNSYGSDGYMWLNRKIHLFRCNLKLLVSRCNCLTLQMASGSNDNSATTALLTERNTLASRVTELEVKVNQLEDQCREVTEEKNSLHRQLGQLKEENTELNEKVKVLVHVYM